jgi:hypothetical protein
MPDVVNAKNPLRRWSRPYDVTLSEVNSDRNLQRNLVAFKYLQNVGTSGLVNIVWEDGTTIDIYLTQGQVIEGGLWRHARTTGTGVGVDLRGFMGIEGMDR